VNADSLDLAINDLIVDFEGGALGDAIDLSELLNGLGGVTDLAGHVQVAQNGLDAVVAVDQTGDGDGAQFVDVAVLQNFTYVADTVKILFDDGAGTPKSDVV
jgi:hypothetical protein